MPILFKKAGSKTSEEESRKAGSMSKFKFNKKGRFTKKEDKKVHL